MSFKAAISREIDRRIAKAMEQMLARVPRPQLKTSRRTCLKCLTAYRGETCPACGSLSYVIVRRPHPVAPAWSTTAVSLKPKPKISRAKSTAPTPPPAFSRCE